MPVATSPVLLPNSMTQVLLPETITEALYRLQSNGAPNPAPWLSFTQLKQQQQARPITFISYLTDVHQQPFTQVVQQQPPSALLNQSPPPPPPPSIAPVRG